MQVPVSPGEGDLHTCTVCTRAEKGRVDHARPTPMALHYTMNIYHFIFYENGLVPVVMQSFVRSVWALVASFGWRCYTEYDGLRGAVVLDFHSPHLESEGGGHVVDSAPCRLDYVLPADFTPLVRRKGVRPEAVQTLQREIEAYIPEREVVLVVINPDGRAEALACCEDPAPPLSLLDSGRAGQDD